MTNREEVEGLVRKIHQTLKRGEGTQDHGLIGNLECILDHVLPHIPYMDEIVAPAEKSQSMTEKSVLERLREDLAKVCDQLTEHFEYAAEDTAAHVLARRYALAESDGSDECAAAIRAHDLSIYESATPQTVPSGIASSRRAVDAIDHLRKSDGAADPDVAGLIELAKKEFEEYFLNNYPKDCIIGKPIWHVPKIFRAATRTLEAALQRQAAELETCNKALLAVAALIDESEGVIGLHLNGDVALWKDLRTGGYFEDWLFDFDAALSERKP